MNKLKFIISICYLLISCGVHTNTSKKNKQSNPKNIIIDNTYVNQKNNIDVISLRISDNTLYINVASETACNHDEFNLYTNDIVLKSMPPKKILSLEHVKKGASCEKLLNKEIAFNINELTQTSYKELVLVLKDKSISLKK